MVKKLAIIREIFKGDHNAAARKLTRNQISGLSGTLNYEAVKFIYQRIAVNGNSTIK